MATLTKFPTANTAASGFDGSWTNPNNAHADDGVYATAAPANRNHEWATFWHGFDFSAIADGSTINSVTVEVEFFVSTTSSVATLRTSAWADHSAGAATTQIGTNSDDATEPAADKVVSFTIPATLAQLKASGFAIQVQAMRGNSTTAVTFSLDYAKVTVDYTEAGGGAGIAPIAMHYARQRAA